MSLLRRGQIKIINRDGTEEIYESVAEWRKATGRKKPKASFIKVKKKKGTKNEKR